MKVVILGKGLMLSNIIKGAIDAKAEIVGVFRYDYTVNNKFKQTIIDCFKPNDALTLIKKYKLPQIKFKSANSDEFKNYLIKNNIDAVIIGTWKEKIKKEIYDTPKIATVNLHPSLLPKYRGPNPYMQNILHGEKYSGITLHLLSDDYDNGAILLQENVPIYEADTSKELRIRTVPVARRLVKEFLTNYENITPIVQDENSATYFKNITGNERMLDFENQTSVEIYRTVKALHPFLPTYITVKNSYYIVNPYKIEISDKIYENKKPNEIIQKSKTAITIICKDKKAIEFKDIKKY